MFRKKTTLTLASALILGSMGSSTVAVAAEPDKSTSTSPPAEKVSGIDRSLFSEAVGPGENFYLYANQKWLDVTDIPGDKSDYGIFTVLSDRTREQVRELIEEAAETKAEPGTPTQKVGDMYRSVLDLKTRNEVGIEPIAELLKTVDAIDDRRSLAAAMGTLVKKGVYGPLVPYVSVDAKNSETYAVYLTQAGLTLPDRDYYLDADQRYQEMRDELKDYIAEMLAAAGGVSSDAEAVFEIEKAIAEEHWTKTANRDPDATYNAKTDEEADQHLGDFAWSAFTDAASIAGRDKYVIRQPSFAAFFGRLMQDRSLSDLKAYLRFRIIDSYASSLTETLERKHFEFHDRT